MTKIISEGKNHTAINIGAFNQLNNYNFIHPKLGHTVKNKLFVGELIKSTSAEISFMELPGKTTTSFLHKHEKHEEIYIFLKGHGKFQIDDEIFDITEGSIVRVAPNGSRTLNNESDAIMAYMVIQATENTLNAYNIADGYRVEGDIKI